MEYTKIVQTTASTSINYLDIIYSFLPLIVCVLLFVLSEYNVSLNLFRKKRVAVIFNDAGEEITRFKIDITKPNFEYNDGKYNIFENKCSRIEEKRLFRKTYLYFYKLNCPSPLTVGVGISDKITSEDYKNIFDSKLIKELNDMSKDGFGKYFTLKNIIIVGAIVGIGYYLMNGGTFTK